MPEDDFVYAAPQIPEPHRPGVFADERVVVRAIVLGLGAGMQEVDRPGLVVGENTIPEDDVRDLGIAAVDAE